MRTSIFAAILLSLAFCAPAHSQSETGSDLLTKCKDFLNTVDKSAPYSSAFAVGFCPGFISGVLSGAEVWEASDTLRKVTHPMAWCRPEQANNGEIIRVFVKFLEDHPERLHEPAGLLLLTSLSTAFPCKK